MSEPLDTEPTFDVLARRLLGGLEWDFQNILQDLPNDEEFFKLFVEFCNNGSGLRISLNEEGVDIYTSEPDWEETTTWSEIIKMAKYHEPEYALEIVKALRNAAEEIEKHHSVETNDV
jgi:hypothetical protein